MATLDDLEGKVYPPLDIMTPIATARGLPTKQFTDRQRQFERTIVAQHNENRAAIREEAEVRAGADFANALYVNEATAEALGFEASVMMRMDAGVSPAGVVARYQIVGRVTADGVEYLNGIYFDFIEDEDNPGEYLGLVHIDASKFTVGSGIPDEDKTFPFRVEGGVVYIENAVIENLSLGTGKLSANAATDVTVGIQAIDKSSSSAVITQGVPVEDDPNITGVVIVYFGFMDKPSNDPANNGSWKLSIERNGVGFDETPALFYDDNFAYPIVAAWFDPSPGIDPTYIIRSGVLSGLGNFTLLAGGLATFTLLKR